MDGKKNRAGASNAAGIAATVLGGALWGFSGACGQYLFDVDAGVLPAGRESVVIAGAVDYNTAGTYTLEYQFANADGVTAVTKLAVVVR